jgi:hypothetical protein
MSQVFLPATAVCSLLWLYEHALIGRLAVVAVLIGLETIIESTTSQCNHTPTG